MKNKTVIVTGATKGLGLATSQHLLEQGAHVVLVYVQDTQHAKQVEKTLQSHIKSMCVVQADITQAADRQRIIEVALKAFGQIDVLVNNAGLAPKAGFLKETEAEYDLVLDVNLKAPIFLAKLVANQMIQQNQGGSIINIASISGHRGSGGVSYDAAKSGLIRATQTMANKLGPYGIRVNSISPGTHKTEMNRHHWENKTELFKAIEAVTPLRRAAEAKEIAGTVLYLASDQSSYTTGTDILVDGGYLAVSPGRG
jgi:NAD(P)-dependent dehydrogenase (short-subunit alcohol dehydrogenase family)